MYPRKQTQQLGEFLRARRDQLRPEDVGLPPGSRRRAPGLRREEAALLCGISPTWLTWIEQGRTTSVSVPTLAAIARGLKLSRAERSYLFELASRADPARQATPDADREALGRLVTALGTPAYVLDRHWDALVWNRAARDLFAPWLGKAPGESATGRHMLLDFVFLDPQARRFIVDWKQRAQRLVGEYRADTAQWRDDPVRQRDVDRLSEASADFAAYWKSQQVLSRDGGLRRFQHPKRGRCDYEQFTLRVALHPDLKLITLVSR
jgi:transcriptional regulator with XRE-family HTH domain